VVPVVNAEALAAGASRSTDLMPVVVVGLAAGQTIGKLMLFEAARHGSARYAGRSHTSLTGTWTVPRIVGRPVATLQVASSRLPVVAVSALTGLPPLAAVAVAAGTTQVKRRGFAATCLVGRTLRLALIAYGPHVFIAT
jgi:membrane protein YqaA with SNARE-associated domain